MIYLPCIGICLNPLALKRSLYKVRGIIIQGQYMSTTDSFKADDDRLEAFIGEDSVLCVGLVRTETRSVYYWNFLTLRLYYSFANFRSKLKSIVLCMKQGVFGL